VKTYKNPSPAVRRRLCQRPLQGLGALEPLVAEIFEAVRQDGDQALKAYTAKFDGTALDELEVKPKQLREWSEAVSPELRQAIDMAYANIRSFHRAQAVALKRVEVETMPGVRCWREPRAVGSVGLYVPGGSAPLFSTVLMLGVPAGLAGCREIILCTPPRPDGSVDPAICYAALRAGIKRVFRAGGAQAIAAMTLGTGTVPRADKIFGPGNQYVTAAKQYASRYGAAIDMPAGPSEVMVVADASARPEFVAADLLSQAEHGPDSQAVLVTTSENLAQAALKALDDQLKLLPRGGIAAQALDNSFCVVTGDINKALAFANDYAPEHLILSVNEPEKAAESVVNAGSVFLGNYSPESAGDYASGTNHTLPTNGWARTYGGVALDSFYKYVTFQSLTEAGARALAPTVMAMAAAEGLEAHKRAMEIRL
jgi:histidinol dehydrogenase